jgi:hypothetical protein
MILVPTSRPLYAAVDPVDFRRSFDVLIAIAREQLGLDALRSAVVLFFNKDPPRTSSRCAGRPCRRSAETAGADRRA